jgi:anaerobic selenocysteine-containing dehydrogenase
MQSLNSSFNADYSINIMEVTFTRTGQRRYRVSVDGPDVVSSYMDPAPGYDERLPHDMAHFIVENELGIKGGVFGQIAAGGAFIIPTDNTKRRKIARRRERIAHVNHKDALLSEHVIAVTCNLWQKKTSEAPSIAGFPAEAIKRVCREFDAASEAWTRLGVGESMTLVWHGGSGRTGRRSRR